MKNIFLVVICSLFSAGAGAYTCEEIAEGLKARYGITKGKFETAAEFASRQKASQAMPIVGSVKQGDIVKFRTPAPSREPFANYDVDKGVMTIDVPILHDLESGYLTQRISDRIVKKETYSASNAFGAKTNVEKTETLTCHIGIAKASGDKNIKLSFKLPKEKAVQTDGNLAFEWAGVLPKEQPKQSSYHTEPKIAAPYEQISNRIIIPLTFAKLSVIDSRTGEVIYSTTKLPLSRFKLLPG